MGCEVFKRYRIKARRRGTDEKWTEWTDADHYAQAEDHAIYCEEVGYQARIEMDDYIKELWGILGGKSDKTAEITDAILDAGFRKQDEVATKLCREIDRVLGTLIKERKILMEIAKEEEKYNALCCLAKEKATLENVRETISTIGRKYIKGVQNDTARKD